jgi:hypothetical protein
MMGLSDDHEIAIHNKLAAIDFLLMKAGWQVRKTTRFAFATSFCPLNVY